MFAAATGLRPGEWLALEHRDIDHEARVVYVRRALRNGRIKNPKTDGSIRAVPLQATALAALKQLPTDPPLPAPIPRPTRRLPRPAQLPLPRLETRPTRDRDRPAATDLRSQTHVRDLRAPCRNLDLRPLPLHGRQPDNDRPPLRPPRQRRPRTRDQPARYLHGRRPPRGRCVDAEHALRRPRPNRNRAKQQQKQSPLSDSNRRPLPYHGRVRVSPAFMDAHERTRTTCKSLQTGVYGRGARNTVEVELVDGKWTEAMFHARRGSRRLTWVPRHGLGARRACRRARTSRRGSR